MAATFIPPFERAWKRTRRILLDPFRAERWLAIGFAAFLAGCAGGGWTAIGFQLRFPPRFERYVEQPLLAFSDFAAGPLWRLGGAPWIVLGPLAAVGLLWISSRGKFVFLDNLLGEHGAIAEPWRRAARLGNSLFLWRLGFAIALWLAFVAILSPMVFYGRQMSESRWMGAVGGATVAAAAILTPAVLAAFAEVALLVESFVVPLMARDRVTVLQAWRTLLPLLRRQPLDFVGYSVLALAAVTVLALALLVSVFATLCIVPLLLAIPLLGTLLALPLLALLRLYGVEFLAEFGPEWSVAPPAPPPLPADPPDSVAGV